VEFSNLLSNAVVLSSGIRKILKVKSLLAVDLSSEYVFKVSSYVQ